MAGVTIYTRSIIPMVFWHGVCDVAARFPNGLYPQSTLEYFVQKNGEHYSLFWINLELLFQRLFFMR